MTNHLPELRMSLEGFLQAKAEKGTMKVQRKYNESKMKVQRKPDEIKSRGMVSRSRKVQRNYRCKGNEGKT